MLSDPGALVFEMSDLPSQFMYIIFYQTVTGYLRNFLLLSLSPTHKFHSEHWKWNYYTNPHMTN